MKIPPSWHLPARRGTRPWGQRSTGRRRKHLIRLGKRFASSSDRRKGGEGVLKTCAVNPQADRAPSPSLEAYSVLELVGRLAERRAQAVQCPFQLGPRPLPGFRRVLPQ